MKDQSSLGKTVLLDACYLAEEIGNNLRSVLMTMPAEKILNWYSEKFQTE